MMRFYPHWLRAEGETGTPTQYVSARVNCALKRVRAEFAERQLRLSGATVHAAVGDWKLIEILGDDHLIGRVRCGSLRSESSYLLWPAVWTVDLRAADPALENEFQIAPALVELDGRITATATHQILTTICDLGQWEPPVIVQLGHELLQLPVLTTRPDDPNCGDVIDVFVFRDEIREAVDTLRSQMLVFGAEPIPFG